MDAKTYLIVALITALTSFVNVGLFGLLTLWVTRKSRRVDTEQKQIESQDTYFKQAVELASQYREELGRQKQIIEALEKKLDDQEQECDRKIKVLQDQINGLISQLQVNKKASNA